MFTQEVLLRLANILDNAGQVFLAITVVSPLISDVDKPDIHILLLGVAITLAMWAESLLLTRRAKQHGRI
ncbi:hypothetical protein HYZ78_01545 [Candidatus Microgenomates bacterium]|nr:hypothetical protein [Candidatus Microgenomates bacterium]